jgi:hypothetical protein
MAEYNLIPAPRRLQQKVPKSGGPTPEEAIRQALSMAEDLMDEYRGWAVDYLDKLWRAFRDCGDSGVTREDITRMFRISHGIRGHGGSFGYPLISYTSDSLCKFLDGRANVGKPELEVVSLHIMVMKAIFRQDLKGPCGTLADDLPELLLALRNKIDMSG